MVDVIVLYTVLVYDGSTAVVDGPAGKVGRDGVGRGPPGATMSSSMAKVYTPAACLRCWGPFDPVVGWPAVTVITNGPTGKSIGIVP